MFSRGAVTLAKRRSGYESQVPSSRYVGQVELLEVFVVCFRLYAFWGCAKG